MAKVDYFDLQKKKKGKIDLPKEIFEAKVNEYVIQEVVRMQLARRRGGNASTKERSDVSGGGKKPYRQKGTGRARHGTIRSPIWEGGGVTFGPRPRSYDFRPPAKVRKAALISALSLLCKDNRVTVLSDFAVKNGKTKEVNDVMQRFELPSALVIDEKGNEMLRRGIKNLQGFAYLPPEGLNVYAILNHNNLILTLKGLEGIINRFDKKPDPKTLPASGRRSESSDGLKKGKS
ncbi:MAG: 50S ribosomal protein L4 [Pseudomonadota bacterium]